MNTSIGQFDALFGERLTIDLPQRDGTTKKVVVTRKWFDEMVRQGKMTDVTASMVAVNILKSGPTIPEGTDDPDALMDALTADAPLVSVENWQIGVKIPKEQYDMFLDPISKELFAVRHHDGQSTKTVVIKRELWEQTKKAMENL